MLSLARLKFMETLGYRLVGNALVADNGKRVIPEEMADKVLGSPTDFYVVKEWSKFFGMVVPEDMVNEILNPLVRARGYQGVS